jgi:alkylation response protein AidB-like acyl-CoA dehydrogenase
VYFFSTAIHGIRRRSAASASRARVKAFSFTRRCSREVYCSELAVQVVYDAMRIVGAESDTKRTPLERLVRVAKTGVPRELAG